MIDIYNQILYNFQKEVVDKAIKQKRYALFMEMGLGKSFTGLSIVQKHNYKKVIIVCQSSKIEDWKDDIENNFDSNILILNKGKEKDDKNIKSFNEGIIITSYNTCWRRESLFKKADKDTMLLIDESQYFKSRTSEIGKWGVKISQIVDNVLLLSGTPFSNGYVDLYNQMAMLGMDMKYKEWESLFCITREVKLPTSRWPFKVIEGYKNVDLLLNAIKTQSVTIKSEEVLELPEQVVQNINLINEKQDIYNKVAKNKIYKELEIPSAGVLFLRLRQLSSGFIEEYKDISIHKKEALRDFFEASNFNLIIFYNFKQELEDIKEISKDLKIKVFELNGSKKDYKESQFCKERYIIASQYISGSEGHNLQWLNHILYYSPSLSYAKYAQSMKRTHRVGQTQRCFYYRFITKKSIEPLIYNTLQTGQDYTDKMFEKDLENIIEKEKNE